MTQKTIIGWITYADWVDLHRHSLRVDSTAPAPAVTGQHVHVQAQSAATSGRTASDEAAGPGEHLDAG